MKTLAPLLLMILFGASAHASNMSAPFFLPSAKVLPKGVRNFNFKGVMTSIDAIYKNDGDRAKLANPMNMNITVFDVILGKKNLMDRAGTSQVLKALGLKSKDILAESTGQINGEVFVSAPILAYGITKRWTAAIAIPIKRHSLNVNTGVKQSNQKDLKRIRHHLEKTGYTREVEEFDRKLANPVYWKALDYGYDPLISFENQTQLGDIKLINKYQALKNLGHELTLSLEATLPTGKKASVDKLVQIPGGDGQADLGLGFNYDYIVMSYLTLSSGFLYTHQFQDTVARRIPEQSKTLASMDKDLNTNRKLGDMMAFSVGGNLNVEGVGLALGYNFQYKQKDEYSGGLYPSYRYDWLSKDTSQKMHALLGRIGYDTISLFKAGRFPVPMLFSLTHTHIMGGKNVVNNPLTTVDFSLFF